MAIWNIFEKNIVNLFKKQKPNLEYSRGVEVIYPDKETEFNNAMWI